ncbi:hypothetical protein M9Y10_003171 [Tritrichomonas musculus]|uniref:Surface antigen BspA-like protein n=1 Tax=Tritrichomonas musculus TaxID=1915356 RepID=A0ABR2JP43_9EUKA
MDCMSLEEITIPESVTFIGDYAFASCSSLHKITMPSLKTSLGRGIFCGCMSLTTMTYNGLENDVKHKYSIPFFMPDDDSLCESIGKLEYTDDFFIPLESIHILNVKDIGKHVFDNANCFGLDNGHIIIPPNVETIDNIAFSGYKNISHIEIPSSLQLIKNNSFLNCISLRMMTVPPTLDICKKAYLKIQFPNN